MLDPRTDMQKDTNLWELVLACATAYNDKQIFYNLQGFRCGGAFLLFEKNKLIFKMSKDWDSEQRSSFKEKYIMPYRSEIKYLFEFCEEYYKDHRGEIDSINKVIKGDSYFKQELFK